MGKFGRLSAFTRGRIVGKAEEGATTSKIRQACLKKDGKKAFARAIRAVVARVRDDPQWDCTDSRASGRPQELTSQEQKKLSEFMITEVGIARVTIPYCKKRVFCLSAAFV